MGTHRTPSMQKVSILVLFALVAAIWAVTEVQEIGNDDSSSGAAAGESVSLDADDSAEYDNIGEGVGRGRASFLSTQGSFTLSSGGGDASNVGEEDELGEGVGRGRASFLSTQGSFTLSSGGGDASNVGEEDEF